ncbi:BglG family transcription antiterminator [Candidatus Stoquefichus massiliensis]|uniref:BglG family transcription antiterminator n=1 Tax=Candidatus Stoquefichus massiliensis TaxID=1470350 RepID=UPI0004809186|nr:PRD domain-containing protein [Candidatus Stoquefichus massiliensis]
MDKKRVIQLIKILSHTQTPISGPELCEQLNVTVRTLRNDIKEYKTELLQNGIEIISKHAVGYELSIVDEEKYYHYLEDMMKEESENQMLIPIYPEERVNYLIRMFLTQDDYIRIEDICDMIFVSRSTLSGDLKEVREKLKYFHLELETKPSYGLMITGSEFHKRSCISQYFYHTNGNDDMFLSQTKSTRQQEEISSILYETMVTEKFKLTDIGFQNLVIHIMIALLRLKEKQQQTHYEYDETIKNTKEYEIAIELCRKIEKNFHVIFPDIEIYYIALHLSGKKAVQYNSNSLFMNHEYEILMTQIINEIKEKYNIDFTADMDLQTSLSLHLQPMMNRLKYGMYIQNPLLEQIKTENPLAFEISVLTANMITKNYQADISENEIGYIALHFALAIERYQKQGPKKNIIIICASGMGSSQILLYKIKQKFKENINSIYVTELYELPNINQSLYDFILSTVPIPFPTQIPAIHVQYFLDNQDMISLSDVFKNQSEMSFVDQYFHENLLFNDLKGKTKEELIHEMCTYIRQMKDVPNEFEEEIFKRENYSVTEFGNMIAMPHPMNPLTNETFVAVGILKKAIKWKHQQVKYIFLLSIQKNSQDALGLLHETLSSLVYDKKAMQELEKDSSLTNLKKILKRIAEEQKENDIDTLFG